MQDDCGGCLEQRLLTLATLLSRTSVDRLSARTLVMSSSSWRDWVSCSSVSVGGGGGDAASAMLSRSWGFHSERCAFRSSRCSIHRQDKSREEPQTRLSSTCRDEAGATRLIGQSRAQGSLLQVRCRDCGKLEVHA